LSVVGRDWGSVSSRTRARSGRRGSSAGNCTHYVVSKNDGFAVLWLSKFDNAFRRAE
jgi:hypothetical protein